MGTENSFGGGVWILKDGPLKPFNEQLMLEAEKESLPQRIKQVASSPCCDELIMKANHPGFTFEGTIDVRGNISICGRLGAVFKLCNCSRSPWRV